MGKLLGFILIVFGLAVLFGGNFLGALIGIVVGLFGAIIGVVGAIIGVAIGSIGGLLGIVIGIGVLLLPIILLVAIIGGLVKLVSCI